VWSYLNRAIHKQLLVDLARHVSPLEFLSSELKCLGKVVGPAFNTLQPNTI